MDILLSILGLPFIVAGIFLYWRGQKLFYNGIKIKAEIVDLIKRKSNSSGSLRGDLHYPVIAFDTKTGQSVRKEIKVGTNPSYYSIGQEIIAVYDPEKPDDCGIYSKFQLLGVPVIVMGLGLIVMAIATGIYLKVF